MRKVSILIIALMSVLTMWGQNGDEFNINIAKEYAADFKKAEPQIIIQAINSKKISDEDKKNAQGILDATFESLDKTLNVYNDIKDDPQLEKTAQKIICKFYYDYQIAITGDDGKTIKVSTRSFLNVAEEYKSKFDEFNEEALKYIKERQAENSAANAHNGKGYNDDDDNEKDSDNNDEGYKDNDSKSTITICDIIAILIGIIGVIIGLCALISVMHLKEKIKHNKSYEIENLKSELNRLKENLTNYRGTQSNNSYGSQHQYPVDQQQYQQQQYPQQQYPQQQYPQQQYPQQQPYHQQQYQQQPYQQQYHQQNQLEEQQNSSNRHGRREQRRGGNQEYNAQSIQSATNQIPTYTYLFATIKAGASSTEFFKVASENTGDKVFMLTLANPNAVTAEFTIASNMPDDFKRTVIADRDVYLPSTFCEKFIDSQNPTSIEVISTGTASLVGGRWQVQDRMKIRLV